MLPSLYLLENIAPLATQCMGTEIRLCVLELRTE